MAIVEKKQLKKELWTFLIITFAATFIFSFSIYLILGPVSVPLSKLWFISLQAYMLIPATVAIICTACFPAPALTRETKIIFTSFLIYAVLFTWESYVGPIGGTVGMPLVALHPTSATEIPLVSLIAAVSGILTMIILNCPKRWRKNLEPSKLSLGKNLRYYLILPLLLAVIIISTFLLNYLSGLGVPAGEFNLSKFFSTLMPSLVLSFFFLWPNYFGEEYGWRAYLQERLFALSGSYTGVLLLGIIWGLWHAPLILLGVIYPGQPVFGVVLMVLNTIVMGIIISYAVLKTGSVWLAVILHLLADTIYPAANIFLASSSNPIFSFGTGIYGLAVLAVFALILLKSPVWKINKNGAV